MRRLTAVGAGALLALTACAATPTTDDPIKADATFEPIEMTDPATTTDVVAASRQLGIDILHAADEGKNLVISPISITLMLGLLGEGADGEAAKEFATHLGADGEERSRAIATLLTEMKKHDGDISKFDPEAKPPETPLLHIANQTVVDNTLEAEKPFLDKIARFHDSGLTKADLSDSASKKILDAWVSEHTAGLIKESKIEPKDELQLVAQNAVLFAGAWKAPFSPARPAPFHLADGTTVDVDMLDGKREFSWTESESWRAAKLDYTKDFNTIVILPPEGTDPMDLSATTLSALTVGVKQNEPTEGVFRMPKLDLTTSLDLMKPLKKVGFEALLNNTTKPLKGITSTDDLALRQAAHQARLIVHETGTVAAAVTEGGAETVSAPPPENNFIVDRPYVFLVQHVKTGVTLFHAVVRNPAETT